MSQTMHGEFMENFLWFLGCRRNSCIKDRSSASWSGRLEQRFNFERIWGLFVFLHKFRRVTHACYRVLGSLHYSEPWRKCPWARPWSHMYIKVCYCLRCWLEMFPWITVQLAWYQWECVDLCFSLKVKTTLKLVMCVNFPENVRKDLC